MKTGAALLVATFLAAICNVNGNGVCYDPDHALGAKSEATIIKDMQAIRAKGFTHVRTYISKFGNTEMAKIIRDQGMTLALGVPYGNPDYAEQLKSAVEVAKGGNVQYMFIGNENLRGSVPKSFIDEIYRVKGMVPSSVKVGTVQRNTEILENIGGLKDLVNACDALGINIHPFFTSGQNGATNAIELTKTQWNKALGIVGDKLVLTETGWPSAGSVAGNKGDYGQASGYFSKYNEWNSIPGDKRFYFQMFDQPTRAEDFEQAYGLFTKDLNDKFNVGVAPAPASPPAYSPPAYSPPASTPAPPAATPAPQTPQATQAQSTKPTDTPATQAPGATPSAAQTTSTPTPTPIATPSTTPGATNATAAAGQSQSHTTGSTASSAIGDVAGSKGHASQTAGSLNGATTSIDATGTSTSDATGGATGGATTADSGVAGTDAAAEGAATDAPRPEVVSNGHGDPIIAGEADKSATNANSQGAAEGGTTTVVFAVAAGCVAVLAAFGFIYQTRKKAAELEAVEAKDSVAITPHGSCVL